MKPGRVTSQALGSADGCRLIGDDRVALFLAHSGDVHIGRFDRIGAGLAGIPHRLGTIIETGGLITQDVRIRLHRIGTAVGCVLDAVGELVGRALTACCKSKRGSKGHEGNVRFQGFTPDAKRQSMSPARRALCPVRTNQGSARGFRKVI